MFFLGIAGPLLPYFLMIGILVAFTLEAGAEVLRKPEKENTDHYISLTAIETGTPVPEGSFYFIGQSDQFQDQKNAENVLFVSGLRFLDVSSNLKITDRNARMRLTDYVDSYFGLSPPSMFV